MNDRWSLFLGLVFGFLIGSFSPDLNAAPVQKSKEILSEVYTIDRLYRSMTGPAGLQTFFLSRERPPELLWVTGYEAILTDPKGKKRIPQEFMCHSVLTIESGDRKDFPVFTLAEGAASVEIPKGFGVPVFSDELLGLWTQVLNHNVGDRAFETRHKARIDFLRDRDIKTPLKPLFVRRIMGAVSLEGRPVPFDEKSGHRHHEAASLPGEDVSHGHGRGVGHDSLGRKFSAHWVVPKGRQVNHTLVTKILNLPYDTTVHYIGAHLHPFAESLELRDLTSGKTVFKALASNFKDRIGLESISHFSSEDGVPLYKDHDYELISVYDNTSGTEQDAMAEMFLYLHQKDFRRP